jgi:hypothetical protein
MSHHFDVQPPDQDISDVYCFAGPSDQDGPRTVFGMNTSPNGAAPWDPATYYELKLDLDDDLVEEITWRFSFSAPDASGNQTFTLAQLTGADATSRTAPGRVILGPGAATGTIHEVDGIKIFADRRLDPFFTDIRVPFNVRGVLPPGPDASKQRPTADPGLGELAQAKPFSNSFQNQNVRSVILELPARITGDDPIQCWGTTAFNNGHAWVQVQRAAIPDVSVVFDNGGKPYLTTINSTGPSEDLAGRPANPESDEASGIWRTIRDQVALVVETIKTYNQGHNGKPTPLAYGVYAADTLLPNVLRFTPGTNAYWDAWNGRKNGKGLHEELASNFARVIVNSDFSTNLTQTEKLDPCFPHLLPPFEG